MSEFIVIIVYTNVYKTLEINFIMSAGLDCITRYQLHEQGISLLQLSPLYSQLIPASPVFYKIFGGVPSAEYELGCLELWLKEAENTEEKRTPFYNGVYALVVNDLDFIIEALDKVSKPDYKHEDSVDFQRAMTIENYMTLRNIKTPYSELRSKFQAYKNLLENIKENRLLTGQEHKCRNEFLEFVKYFITLEQDYARSMDFLNSQSDGFED